MTVGSISSLEQRILLMWDKFVERELDEENESSPRIILEHFRTDRRLSTTLIERMIRSAREYGHEV